MKNNRFFLAVSVMLAMAFIVSCSSDDEDKSGYCFASNHGYNYCFKTVNGRCLHETFTNNCPSNYDSSPKACVTRNDCTIINPLIDYDALPYTLTENSCRTDLNGDVGDYNRFCL